MLVYAEARRLSIRRFSGEKEMMNTTIVAYRFLRTMGFSNWQIVQIYGLYLKEAGMKSLKMDWKTSVCFFVAALCGYLATLPQLVEFSGIFKAIAALATAIGGFLAADSKGGSKVEDPEPLPDNKPKEP